MNKNLISICIANYNKSPYIEECLNSIKKIEGNSNIEIIIVDDCSTDNSIEIINKWINKNSQIKTILNINKKNSGPGTTYNNAIKLAKGEYITFMDSDDFFLKSTLTDKIDYFKKNKELKIIYGNGTFFENNVLNGNSIHNNIIKLFEENKYEPKKILDNIICKVPMLSVSSSLIKKEFLDEIGGFDEECFSNDRVLNIKIFKNLKNKNQFTINKKIAFGYRINEDNISKNYDRILLLLSQVIEKYCPKELQNIGYSNIYFTNALSNLTIGNYKKAFFMMKSSIKYNFEFKKLFVFLISLFVPYKILKILPRKLIQRIKSIVLRVFQ